MTLETLKSRLATYKEDKAKYELLKLRSETDGERKEGLKPIEYTIKEIDILLSALTTSEFKFIKCKYFEQMKPYDLLDELNISEATISRHNNKILKKMLSLYN